MLRNRRNRGSIAIISYFSNNFGAAFQKNNAKKRLGRYSTLIEEQEKDFVNRIYRLAGVGLPVTPLYFLTPRHAIFLIILSDIKTSRQTKLFFRKHPGVVRCRALQMNPVRMNLFIVKNYLNKLMDMYTKLELFDKPGNVYNMDTKGCRLTIHKQHVLVKKKPEQVHLVTVVACGNALEQTILSVILKENVVSLKRVIV